MNNPIYNIINNIGTVNILSNNVLFNPHINVQHYHYLILNQNYNYQQNNRIINGPLDIIEEVSSSEEDDNEDNEIEEDYIDEDEIREEEKREENEQINDSRQINPKNEGNLISNNYIILYFSISNKNGRRQKRNNKIA